MVCYCNKTAVTRVAQLVRHPNSCCRQLDLSSPTQIVVVTSPCCSHLALPHHQPCGLRPNPMVTKSNKKSGSLARFVKLDFFPPPMRKNRSPNRAKDLPTPEIERIWVNRAKHLPRPAVLQIEVRRVKSSGKLFPETRAHTLLTHEDKDAHGHTWAGAPGDG